ncbi:hypothetical protein HMPREF9098_1839 [Kingella denitrificans ATCC 33394]|uniref:Uncharacterized protein n=1 Tax=Kingella denitrificans ATCC 33394 TaxID=888741 RepID=F0F154_9NEIS|nr:hypothetical protein HMPREF9098_1839 [Kingella denitrificans ATCC 33394]
MDLLFLVFYFNVNQCFICSLLYVAKIIQFSLAAYFVLFF